MRTADVDLAAFIDDAIGIDQEVVSNIGKTTSIHVQVLDIFWISVGVSRVMDNRGIQGTMQVIRIDHHS